VRAKCAGSHVFGVRVVYVGGQWCTWEGKV